MWGGGGEQCGGQYEGCDECMESSVGSVMSIVRESAGGSVGVGSSVAQALPCTPTTTNIKNV